jgi:hypothetical protein
MEETLVERFEPYFKHPDADHYGPPDEFIRHDRAPRPAGAIIPRRRQAFLPPIEKSHR